MSSTNKTDNYQLSQFVGTDIPSILNDYNGDMRKIDSAIHNASVAGGDNATAIAELQTATARMNTEISGINSNVNTLSGKVLGVESVIPATASAENKLLTAQELPEIPSIAELEEEVSGISADVKAIQLCVPANASENNKLATKDDIKGYVIGYTVSSSATTKREALKELSDYIDTLTPAEKRSIILEWGNDIFYPSNHSAKDYSSSYTTISEVGEYPAFLMSCDTINLRSSASNCHFRRCSFEITKAGIDNTRTEATDASDDIVGGTVNVYIVRS